MTLSAYCWQLALEFRKREPHVFSPRNLGHGGLIKWRTSKSFNIWMWFFPRASERRVLLIVGVWYTSSHLLTVTSTHIIFTSSHLHILSSHIIIESSHLHIYTYHLHIFASAHLHISSSHLHILSSHLLSLSPSHSLSISFFLSLLPSVTVYLLLFSFLS